MVLFCLSIHFCSIICLEIAQVSHKKEAFTNLYFNTSSQLFMVSVETRPTLNTFFTDKD